MSARRRAVSREGIDAEKYKTFNFLVAERTKFQEHELLVSLLNFLFSELYFVFKKLPTFQSRSLIQPMTK